MARYEHLPIYAKAYQLALYVEQQVHGFPRFHKYALGADLRMLCRQRVAQRRSRTLGLPSIERVPRMRSAYPGYFCLAAEPRHRGIRNLGLLGVATLTPTYRALSVP